MAESGRPRVTLPAARKAEIAELAEIVAAEHFPSGKVDPKSVADKREITISFGHYKEAFDGLLEHLAGEFHIYCNLDRLEHPNRPRARFTIAHELGHFFIEEHHAALVSGRSPGHGSFAEYESRNPAEQEADHFASNLLMPQNRFRRAAKGKPPGLAGIKSLADDFGTSVTSTAIRFASLEVRPCLVVKWASDGYKWKWLSTSARSAGYRRTIESVDKVIKGSATEKAMTGQVPPASGIFESVTTAATWFHNVAEDGRRNIILIEHAMQLGRFGVLTFLFPQAGDFEPEHL
jgi:Zn-dependent peptidase ImmA (M78 family)